MTDFDDALELDARLLEQALQEDWPREHPQLRDLLRRRPAWTELLDGPPPALPEGAAPLAQDRRLTDEFLALARQRQTQRSKSPPLRRWSSPWRLAAAALALLFAGALLSRPWLGRAGDESVELLGSDQEAPRIDLERPLSSVERIDHFEFRPERDLKPGEAWLLILSDVDGDGRPVRELLRRKLDKTKWTPDALDLADLPLRLHWSVQHVSATGDLGPRYEAWVERSSR